MLSKMLALTVALAAVLATTAGQKWTSAKLEKFCDPVFMKVGPHTILYFFPSMIARIHMHIGTMFTTRSR